MKILLLNDNPVVRKLVALSAQKTKDDLSVIWSVDEVEDNAYDLLIVDDAHYSDESMEALKEKITYKTSLLMATRGNTIPNGFDKIINKPFLPTDLVDLFAKIDSDLGSSSQEVAKETAKAIVLDDSAEKDFSKGFDITNLDDDLNLEDFDIEDDEGAVAVKTNVLDHEEVQELQDLLDDTDGLDLDDELLLDGLELDDEMTDTKDDDILKELDDDLLNTLEDETPSGSIENEMDDAIDEFDFDENLLADEPEAEKLEEEVLEDEELDDLIGFDEDILADDEELVKPAQEALEDEELDDLIGFDEDVLADDEELAKPVQEALDEDLDDLMNFDEDATVQEEAIISKEDAVSADELDDIDALLLDGLSDMDEEGEALSDDEFGELEQQIQEAVEDLGIEDLSQGFDDAELGDLSGLADLDSLSERDIKLAIGEEVDDEETDIRIGHGGDHSSLDAEALSEAMGELPALELDDELENIDMDSELVNTSTQEHNATPAEGIDALQALLKALSNEEVSKTLKGLSINININFGNEK